MREGAPVRPTTKTGHPMNNVSPGIQAVLDRVTAILPDIKAAADDGDRDRRTSDHIIEKLREAGALGITKPKRYGGLEANAREMIAVSSLVGQADPGAAWVVMLTNIGGWLAGHYSHEAQAEVWDAGVDTPLVTGVLMPTSTATKVPGGYRVSGEWAFNSGSWWSDWSVLGFPVPDENGEIVSQANALIHKDDLTIKDTWFITGMRGSASNTVVADDVFVPEHRVLDTPNAIAGGAESESAADEPVFRSAFIPMLALVLVGPSLGAIEAALDYVTDRATRKPVSQTFYEKQSDSTAVQLNVARAAQLIEVARLLTFDAADRIDNWGVDGVYPEPLERARVRANVGQIVESIRQAIELLLWVHGSGSYAESNQLQRLWRDIHVGTSHAVASPSVSFEAYGRLLLSNETPITPMI